MRVCSTGKVYKARPRGGRALQCSLSGSCTLGISIGADFHEAGKLEATVLWLSEHFDSCAILLCDTLQRYNYDSYFRGEHEVALSEALQSGDEWLKRNKKILSRFAIPVTITRWEDWREHSGFESRLESITQIWQESEEMQRLILDDIQRFIANNPLSPEQFPLKARIAAGAHYLLEELAGLSLFADEYGSLEVYAGAKIRAIEYLKDCKDSRAPESFKAMRSIKIDFVRLKSLEAPQAAIAV